MSRLPIMPPLQGLIKGKAVVVTGGFNRGITKLNLDRAIKSLGATVAAPRLLQQGNIDPRATSSIGTVVTGDNRVSSDRVLSALNQGITVVPASQFIRYAAERSKSSDQGVSEVQAKNEEIATQSKLTVEAQQPVPEASLNEGSPMTSTATSAGESTIAATSSVDSPPAPNEKESEDQRNLDESISYDLDRLIEKYEAKSSQGQGRRVGPKAANPTKHRQRHVVGALSPNAEIQVSKVLVDRLLNTAIRGLRARSRSALVGKVNAPSPALLQRRKATFKNMIKAMVYHRAHVAQPPPSPLSAGRPRMPKGDQLQGKSFSIANSVRSKEKLRKLAIQRGMEEVPYRTKGLDKSVITYLVSPEVFPTAALKWKRKGCHLMTTSAFRKMLS